jgi:hypothetical protein
LFGGIDSGPSRRQAVAAADDTVELNDLKDHLKHARKVAQAIKVSTMESERIQACCCNVMLTLENPLLFYSFTERFTWPKPF